jgi:hypothetical protein
MHRDLESILPTTGAAVDATVQQRLQVLQMRDQTAGHEGESAAAPEPDWRRELAIAMAAERQTDAACQQPRHEGSADAVGGISAEDIDEGGWLPK